jgi:hypothetical protein
MRHSAGGGSARLRDIMVLDVGGPDLTVRVVEVEARGGEPLVTGPLHACVVALLAILGNSPHRIVLESELLPFG